MKKYIISMLIIAISFAGCKKNPVPPIEEEGPINWELKWKTDCWFEDVLSKKTKDAICVFPPLCPFIETYLKYFQCPKVYFIKGVAQEVVYEYGLNIKLIEDIKGNFPQDTGTIFTAFGFSPNNAYLSNLLCGYGYMIERTDPFYDHYKEQDTLLMLLCPARDWLSKCGITNEELTANGYEPFYEKDDDYGTLPHSISTIKLENGNVIGGILPSPDSPFGVVIDTLSYKYFQKKLKEIK